MSEKENKHILVVVQYFYPEQFRINDICKEWIKKGYHVTVLTGIPNYPQGRFYTGYGLFKRRRETYHGVDIIRIPIIPRGDNVVLLALNYLSFVISGFLWALSTRLKADCVFIYGLSPMTMALPGVWYAGRNKVPCGLYVADLWPENVEIITGIHDKLFLGTIGGIVDYIYKRCDRIFTASRGFIKSIHKRGIPKSKLYFWPQYAEDFYHPVDNPNANEIPQDAVFNITFAGNIGYAQGLGILPKVAWILKREGIKVRFNIIGEGRYKEKLMELITKKDLSDYFNLIDKKPAEMIPYYMASSDAALICLAKSEVFSMTIPAKTQSSMACAVPILVSGDGEVQDVIHRAKCGFCSDAEDVKGLALNIRKMARLPKDELLIMGKNGLQYTDRYFNKEKLLTQIDRFFKESNI